MDRPLKIDQTPKHPKVSSNDRADVGWLRPPAGIGEQACPIRDPLAPHRTALRAAASTQGKDYNADPSFVGENPTLGVRHCRNRRCGVPVSHFRCGACEDNLWERFVRDLTEIKNAAANLPYVGRTAIPERRLLQQVAEERRYLTVLHWANDIEEADVYEERLIALARHLCPQGTANDDKSGGGDFSGYYQALYVAWSPHPAATTSLPSRVVTTLDAGTRMWPEPDQSRALNLRFEGTLSEASAILRYHRERGRDYCMRRRERYDD